ncbi:MAG: arginase family protein, partial [Oricola sp.]|nr:arginase family protein [Oricola sp.]
MTGRKRTSLLKGGAAFAALSLSLAGLTAPVAAEPSPEVQQKLDALSAEETAFISDPANLVRFGLTTEKLHKLIAAKDAEAAKAMVAAMMAAVEEAKFQPGEAETPEGDELNPIGDMSEVPLNPLAPGFNGSTVLRPAILDDRQRDPGPFSLKRYMYETDGIPTFAGAPVAIRKEDLIAGGIEAAFVGVPLGMSSGWRDSKNAPGVMRAMYGIGGYDIYAGVDPTLELSIADYGNLSIDPMSLETSVDHIRMMIGEMVDAGVVPIVVGGDHSVMFPTVAAMADQFGAGNVGVVHFDAHYNGA